MIESLFKIYFKYLTSSFFILGCFTLISCATIFDNQPNGQFLDILNMPYHEARKVIITNGWKPSSTFQDEIYRDDESEFGYVHPFLKLGYRELGTCSGTGKAYCDFYFQNTKGEILRVITEGEDDGVNAKRQARIVQYGKEFP